MAREGVVVCVGGRLFVDVDVSGVYTFADAGEPVGLDDVVFLLDLTGFVEGCVGEAVVAVRYMRHNLW